MFLYSALLGKTVHILWSVGICVCTTEFFVLREVLVCNSNSHNNEDAKQGSQSWL